MQRPVVRRRGSGIGSNAWRGADPRERRTEAGRRREPLRVDLRREKMSRGRRFDGLPGRRRRGHARGRTQRDRRMAGHHQQKCDKTRTPGERPRKSAAPTHQDELSRSSNAPSKLCRSRRSRLISHDVLQPGAIEILVETRDPAILEPPDVTDLHVPPRSELSGLVARACWGLSVGADSEEVSIQLAGQVVELARCEPGPDC